MQVEILMDTATSTEAADLVSRALNVIDWDEVSEGYFTNLTIRTEYDALYQFKPQGS